MKIKIATVFLTLATVFCFANTSITENYSNLKKIDSSQSIRTKEHSAKSFIYLKMGVSNIELPKIQGDALPGLGVGYRLLSGFSALDFSASFNRRDVDSDTYNKKEGTYSFTLPKVNYLYYLSEADDSSLYVGGGLAWGKTSTQKEHHFLGLISNLVLGYEMNRNAAWRSFIQVDISQPAIATRQFETLPKLFSEITLGAGF